MYPSVCVCVFNCHDVLITDSPLSCRATTEIFLFWLKLISYSIKLCKQDLIGALMLQYNRWRADLRTNRAATEYYTRARRICNEIHTRYFQKSHISTFFFQISLSARHEWWRRMTAPVEWIRIGIIILCPGGMCTERYLIRTCPECHWDKLFNWGPVSIVERSDGVQRSRFSAARCHAYQSQPSRKPSVKSPVYVLLYHWFFFPQCCSSQGATVSTSVVVFDLFSALLLHLVHSWSFAHIL